MQLISQPFLLTGAKNIRELGGYHTETGAVTKTHSLLRGDALHVLTDEDCHFLYNYGVSTIIDLRSMEELEQAPDRLPALYRDIVQVHIPIQDHVRAVRYSGEFPPSMWELYCWLLDDSGESFLAVFETILRCEAGAVLFHCSGGKDRTGMVAMLLLALAGVDEETIVGDYAISETAMKEVFPIQTAQMEARGLVVPPYIMQSPPDNMVRALSHLVRKYGSAEGYLLQLGFTKEQVARIKSKLVD